MHTECKIEKSLFQGFGQKKIEINFNGGKISSDGGLLLLSKVDKAIGLTNSVSNAIGKFDKRQVGKIEHKFLDMIRQRVYGIACGNEDLNDHDSLRTDELFQISVGKEKELAGSSTLCRFENNINREGCIEISKILVEKFIESFRTAPKELILDFDATDDETHGNQEGSFFHGYYDHYCFLPLYVFCGHNLLASYLRPSNLDAATHSWAILSLLVKRFRQEWQDVKIVFRGDSGFCRWKMLRWCEKNGVQYVVGLPGNARLEAMTNHIAKRAQRKFNWTKETSKLYTEIYYAANTWDKKRKIIVKAEHTKHGKNLRFLVTNIEDKAKYLYEKIYCERGDMENRIKEQQLDLFADRTSCHGWWPNQFRLLLASLAYTLIERLRNLALKNTVLERAQASTIRLKLIKIGAIVRKNTRKIYISLSSAYPYKEVFVTAMLHFASG